MDFKYINDKIDHCLTLAQDAYAKEEVPIGAMIISEHGELLAESFNLKEMHNDATAHAELLAIKTASDRLKSWRLNNCSLFVTLEPCPMCLSAILQARIKNLYFGTYDKKGGAISLGYNFHKDNRLNHNFNVYGGFRHLECAQLLTDFFKSKRKNYNT